jgi:Tol biopolymer transport system component
VQANSESSEPSLSGDGKVLAFTSGASNLTAGVSGINTLNVYRRDLAAASNTLVTASAMDGSGVGGGRPMLSEDGNRLAFYSFSAALVAGDVNGLWDVFVYDHTAGTRQRVSLTSTGGERNQGSESASRVVAPTISGNGRYVAYATTATNVVAGDTNGLQDVFVVDTTTGAVQRVSTDAAGLQGNGDSPVGQGERIALSYDGTWVAYTTAATNLGAPQGGVLLKNRVTGELSVLSANLAFGYAVTPPQLSRDAAYAAFGAATPLDTRYASSGMYVRFTGLGKAWWWL